VFEAFRVVFDCAFVHSRSKRVVSELLENVRANVLVDVVKNIFIVSIPRCVMYVNVRIRV